MDKIISLFLYLMQTEKTTIKNISEKFGWSYRTTHRKLVLLSLCVPISTIQGRRGGYLY